MTFDRDMYQQKKDYVGECAAWLSAHPDFKKIEYVRLFRLDEEFIRMDFVTGPVVINVTGDSILAIAMDLARFMTGVKLDSIVTNIEKLREVDRAVCRRIA